MAKRRILLFIVPVIIVVGLFRFLTVPVKINTTDIRGFTPFRDDALAVKYTPVFRCPREYGTPQAVYYRASRDEKGNIHIAYHPVWEREINRTRGLMPFLSRILYTGGLRLQRTMFGKGDVEVVGFVVDRQGNILKIDYETAHNYDPKKFLVAHKDVSKAGAFTQPVIFRVISWNHLFDLVDSGNKKPVSGEVDVKLVPVYFNSKLWTEYGMFKEKETRLKKNRAHFHYEREYTE